MFKAFELKSLVELCTTFMTNSKRPYVFENLKPTELAWLAGLFQAEAYFTSRECKSRKTDDPDYIQVPPIPIVKLEMIEEDLMEHVAKLLDQNVVKQERKTTAGNVVYRITIQAREKTEVFLRTILPYVVGTKTRSKINMLLAICDDYNKWVAEGGKSKAAKLAAKSKKPKQTETNPD